MRKVSRKVQVIGNGQNVELLKTCTARGIDGEQNWPGDQTANKAHDGNQLEVAQEQVRVERVVLQHIGIWQPIHCSNPVEEARGRLWGALIGS